MRKTVRIILKGFCFCAIFGLLFLGFQEILRGKWLLKETPRDAITTAFDEYRSLGEDSPDVLFLGTSHVYYGVDAMHMYEETGVTGFTIGGPSVRIDLTYLAMKEIFRANKPKVVFLDISSIQFTKQQSEAKMHITADQVALDKEKVEFAYNSGNKKLDSLGLIFPLLRYHSRWKELKKIDFEYVLGQIEEPPVRGHAISYRVETAEFSFDQAEEEIVLSERFYDYFERIVRLCDEEQVELVLFKVPFPMWTKTESQVAENLAKQYGLKYYELYYEMDEIGLDVTKDFHDESDHLNQYGAEKLSVYLGNLLKENHNLEDRRGQLKRWDDDLESYHAYKAERKNAHDDKKAEDEADMEEEANEDAEE